MASLRLHFRETHYEELPPVCMICGDRAHTHIRKNFAWHPTWVPILILAGLLVYIIVALILTKRMTVEVPVCDRHRGYWIKKGLLLWLPILLVAGVGFAIFMMLINDRRTEGAAGMVCLGSVGLFVVWLIVAVVVHLQSLRPTEITDRTITLTRVHDAFVAAFDDMMDAQRRRYDEEDRGRRPSRYADDYGERPLRQDRGQALPPDAFREDEPPQRDERYRER